MGHIEEKYSKKSAVLMKILEGQKIMNCIIELEKPDIRYVMTRKLFLISLCVEHLDK